MAIFVDLFMAAFLLLALVLGIRQGFVQSLARVAIVIVALLGAAWLAQQLAEPAAGWLEPILTEKIQQQLDGQTAADAAGEDPSLAAAGILETFGFSGDTLDELVQSVTDKAQEVGQTLLSAVVSTVLHSVAYAVVYLLSFCCCCSSCGCCWRRCTCLRSCLWYTASTPCWVVRWAL